MGFVSVSEEVALVRAWDASRPRSQQAEVGWSEVGGCRAHMGFRLEGAWASDETDNWGAIRGTALHTLMEEVLAPVAGMFTEITTSYRGIPGHADLMVESTRVTDWKTKSLASSLIWREDPAAFRQARIQVQGYAAGLVDDGKLPGNCRVRIVVIPVDGTFADWWAWEEPFDRSLADEGADRLESVKRSIAAGERLPKDMHYAWCRDWCEFFSMCRGSDDPAAPSDITDPETVAAIAAYGKATEEMGRLKKARGKIAPLIRGMRGTAGEWRITLGEDSGEGSQPDMEAIAAIFAERGEEMPTAVRAGRAGQMRVTRIKKKAAA